jgi:hypothetical protein
VDAARELARDDVPRAGVVDAVVNPRELGVLEKRLEKEPGNLPLRVTVAGHLRDAGRTAEAVELYRSVAVAYRGQGRNQQAIAVCRSILELAPDDTACRALLFELTDPTTPPPVPGIFARPPQPPQPTASGTLPPPSDSTTPLPKPLPYHVHDPTASVDRISRVDVDLPAVEGADTRPGDEDRSSDTTGLAEAARQISGLIAGDTMPLSRTGNVVRLTANEVPADPEAEQVTRTSEPDPVTHAHAPADFDEAPTPVPTAASRPRPRTAPPMRDTAPTVHEAPEPHAPSRDTEEDLTTPRERVAEEPLENAFFSALPAGKRDAALRRCTERALLAGETAIRAGETAHPLILVVSGRLEVRADRPRGAIVLETVEPGQYIGEAALLARMPAPQAVIAATDSVVLALAPHALFELAGAFPALWAALKEIAERRSRLYT